jgi:hypothetical protein
MRTILVLALFLTSSLAEAKKCPVRGDLIRWQMALCAREAETDDCENAALTDCVSKLISAAGKKTECEQKKDLKKRIDDSCKKKGPCPKTPPIVANGCGE